MFYFWTEECLLFLQYFLGERGVSLPLAYHHFTLPSGDMEGLLRLCLLDSGFPAFVEEVENKLKRLSQEWIALNIYHDLKLLDLLVWFYNVCLQIILFFNIFIVFYLFILVECRKTAWTRCQSITDHYTPIIPLYLEPETVTSFCGCHPNINTSESLTQHPSDPGLHHLSTSFKKIVNK